MQKEEIEKVIAKYRKKAGSIYDDEKSRQYEDFADYIEDNIEMYEENERYETEEDLLDDYHEVEAETDAQWESMFPEGDDDDSVTDYVTR